MVQFSNSVFVLLFSVGVRLCKVDSKLIMGFVMLYRSLMLRAVM
jgi:hypothetical protein